MIALYGKSMIVSCFFTVCARLGITLRKRFAIALAAAAMIEMMSVTALTAPYTVRIATVIRIVFMLSIERIILWIAHPVNVALTN